MKKMLEKLKGGLIVSCYAGPDFNAEMGVPQTMVCVAKSCIAGGACAIRTNWENVAAVKAAVDVPVICVGGVGCADDIVDAVDAGADAVACASVLHYNKTTVPQLKAELRDAGVEVRA